MVLGHTLFEPELLCLEIRLETGSRIAFKVGDIETIGRKLVDFGQKFPRVLNSLFLCQV